MEYSFWNERWQAGRTAFHQANGHPDLPERLSGRPMGRALVPLAGKTVDIVTLQRRGYEVVAVEFVDDAVQAFAADQPQLGLAATQGPLGLEMTGDRVRFLAADFFGVTEALVGRFDLVYDRAALVALPPADRQRYVDRLRTLVAPTGEILTFTFEYDPSEMQGPPFSVPVDTVRALYPGAHVDAVGARDALPNSANLADRGLTALTEHTLVIKGAAAPGGQK